MENKPHTEGDSTDASPEHLDPVLSKAKAPRASLSWSSLSCKPQRGYMDLTRPRHAAPSSLGLTQPGIPGSLDFFLLCIWSPLPLSTLTDTSVQMGFSRITLSNLPPQS